MHGKLGLGILVGAWVVACGGAALEPEPDGGSGAGNGATGGTTGSGGLATGGSMGSGGSGGGSSTSTSHQPIVSGTVPANVMVGAATAACQQNLRLLNPAQSLSGYLIMSASAYQNDARAGDPSYAYLDAGKDAVTLPGQAAAYDASSISAAGAQITTCMNAESACLGQDGYRVQVNSELAYVVVIDDWEEEIALGEVELCLSNGTLSSQFVFAGIAGLWGGGVTSVRIIAVLKGVAATATSPVQVEARG